MKIQKNLFKPAVIASLIAVVSSAPTWADSRSYVEPISQHTAYAKVVQVTPVYETYQVNKPVEQCWYENQPVRQHANYSNSYDRPRGKGNTYTPEVLGALLGAAVGNRFGKGSGRDAATVAGAVLGGTLGHDVKRRSQNKRYNSSEQADYRNEGSYRKVQICETRDSYSTQQRVNAYDVAYKYNGNVYHTQLNSHPGDQIRVRVTVDPV